MVDGGGSKRCALLGDNIAEMAHKNGWSVSTVASPAVLQTHHVTRQDTLHEEYVKLVMLQPGYMSE